MKKETSCRHFFRRYARHLREVHESASNDQAQTGIPCPKSAIHSVGTKEIFLRSLKVQVCIVRVYTVSFCTATLNTKVCNQQQMKWKEKNKDPNGVQFEGLNNLHGFNSVVLVNLQSVRASPHPCK